MNMRWFPDLRQWILENCNCSLSANSWLTVSSELFIEVDILLLQRRRLARVRQDFDCGLFTIIEVHTVRGDSTWRASYICSHSKTYQMMKI